jgi:hypothetical protein
VGRGRGGGEGGGGMIKDFNEVGIVGFSRAIGVASSIQVELIKGWLNASPIFENHLLRD